MTLFRRTYDEARATISALADSGRPETIRGLCFTVFGRCVFVAVVSRNKEASKA